MSEQRIDCIMAIDPGLTGAVAFYFPALATRDHVSVYDMPVVENTVNPMSLRDLIRLHEPSVAIIERVGPMPTDGVMQAWRFSSAYTTACVVTAMCNVPQERITPAQWKRAMKLPGGRDNKDHSRGMAMRLFPSNAITFARKKDAGRAEAALLAYHYANTKGLLNVAIL